MEIIVKHVMMYYFIQENLVNEQCFIIFRREIEVNELSFILSEFNIVVKFMLKEVFYNTIRVS